MARTGFHNYEVGGIPMGHLPRRQPMGRDPNYRGGTYRGQRFDEQEGQAPYGRYRAQHGRELDDHGGFRGGATGAGMLRDPGPMRPSGPIGGPRPRLNYPLPRYDERAGMRSAGQGGGRAPRYDGSYRGQRRDGGYGGGGRSGGRDDGRMEAGRGGRFDASRPLRYDGGFSRYGGYRGGGFSEGFQGSAF
jgi:hypothetical protein